MMEITKAELVGLISQVLMMPQTSTDVDQTIRDHFISIRNRDGKLLFRYHPGLNAIETGHRGKKQVINLGQYEANSKLLEQLYDEVRKLDAMSATSAAIQGGANGRQSNE